MGKVSETLSQSQNTNTRAGDEAQVVEQGPEFNHKYCPEQERKCHPSWGVSKYSIKFLQILTKTFNSLVN
jgi:hypothetical protein